VVPHSMMLELPVEPEPRMEKRKILNFKFQLSRREEILGLGFGKFVAVFAVFHGPAFGGEFVSEFV
jgi:hypothetical protein